jgi:hypothetical protein
LSNQLIIVGFLVLAALQIALHLRLGRVPKKAGSALTWALLRRAGADARAIQEGAATVVGKIVEGLERHHEKIQKDQQRVHEVLLETLATQSDMSRERDAQLKHPVDLARALRDTTRKTCLIERELAELVTARVPILRPPPVPRATLPPSDDHDPEGQR